MRIVQTQTHCSHRSLSRKRNYCIGSQRLHRRRCRLAHTLGARRIHLSRYTQAVEEVGGARTCSAERPSGDSPMSPSQVPKPSVCCMREGVHVV